jgi:hypothetical protein
LYQFRELSEILIEQRKFTFSMEKMAVFTHCNNTVKFYSKNQVFGHKKSEKSTRIFLNTDFGREKNPLTGNTYIFQQKKF